MPGTMIQKICLSCKHFRPTAEAAGICRVARGAVDPSVYPVTTPQDSCSKWRDAGQQYYIRLGWIKSQQGAMKNG